MKFENNSSAEARKRFPTETRDDFVDKTKTVPTDTRDDILEAYTRGEDASDDENLIPCGWLEFMRRGLTTRIGYGSPCEVLSCTACLEDVHRAYDILRRQSIS